ncbi:DUSAM domain-containing protein [Stigmatella erecta]|nr:DUSAM domain-containing protein [Stigmatella erecta]
MAAKIDWDPIRRLAQQVLDQRTPLELTDEVRALLRRSAEEVAIPAEESEKALRTLRTARALLRKIHSRIRVGSDRLGKARSRAYRLRDAGNLEGARQHIEKVLAVEVVPLYREHAENVLLNIGRFQAVAETGQADPELPELSQLPLLLRRIRHGKPLELTDGMRAFLRRAAVAVALSESETQEALVTPETAGVLLGKIMARFDEGSRRIKSALERMMELRDTGDLEGARQQMRDVLRVEIVPLYRRMAEEHLAGLCEQALLSGKMRKE